MFRGTLGDFDAAFRVDVDDRDAVLVERLLNGDDRLQVVRLHRGRFERLLIRFGQRRADISQRLHQASGGGRQGLLFDVGDRLNLRMHRRGGQRKETQNGRYLKRESPQHGQSPEGHDRSVSCSVRDCATDLFSLQAFPPTWRQPAAFGLTQSVFGLTQRRKDIAKKSDDDNGSALPGKCQHADATESRAVGAERSSATFLINGSGGLQQTG